MKGSSEQRHTADIAKGKNILYLAVNHVVNPQSLFGHLKVPCTSVIKLTNELCNNMHFIHCLSLMYYHKLMFKLIMLYVLRL